MRPGSLRRRVTLTSVAVVAAVVVVVAVVSDIVFAAQSRSEAQTTLNGRALQAEQLADQGLSPDQVWVVVDVGRKPADTAAMVAAVAARTSIAGIVSIGAAETATPESVHLLGLPVLSLG